MTVAPRDFADELGDSAIVAAIHSAKPVRLVQASPYAWRDPATIPPRPWVYGRWFLRGTVACVVAPGGAGKSTMLAGTALALASGQDFLGKKVWEGPKRVWLWNLEDDMDELSRSIQAAAVHHGLEPEDIAGRLFVDSGMEGVGLCTAVEADGQFKLLEPIYEALTAEIERRHIDVLIVDPFVSSHEVEENANSKIDKIAKAWGRVAKAANCVIVLVHHTSKAGSADVTAMSARGAVALINAARSTLVLNRMTDEQAQELGITPEMRGRYVSVADDKHNRAPAEKADWYELIGVDLGNGVDHHPGDSIAVAVPWTLPNPFDDVTAQHLERVKNVIDGGGWRENAQSAQWAGHAVAQVLGLDADNKADKGRIKSILRQWISNGALKVERRMDKTRQERPFIVVGRWGEQ
ncbi:MAG TPA: AAA family ATPase [Sphingobium sp.]|nr:AAA family ATPase [Sphingobium sp.]